MPEPGSEKKEEPKSMGWGLFLGYLSSGIGSVVFLYYFYKARYSLHQTEILLLEAFRRLPLYWPAGPKPAEVNSRWEAEGLPEDIKLAFCEWFVVTDLEEPKGVTRDDVLELFNELGLREEAQPAKDFLYRGEGHIEEKKRLACVGLQESLTLMSALRTHYGKQREVAEAKGEEPPPPPKSDGDALEILKRKFRRVDSVLSSARRLRDAAGGPGMPADSPEGMSGASAATMTPVMPLPQAAPGEVQLQDCADLDETDDTQLEDARLRRKEDELLSRRDRLGTLSPAEEADRKSVV